MTTLVTGATGFLGSALTAALLDRGEEPVVALVRARDDAHADERMRAALRRIYGDAPVPGRLRAVAGDLERPLPVVEADVIVHCGASITFDLPLAEARAINVQGTLNVLELAAATGARLVHVSTAYVSGARPGVFGEHELDLGVPFRNSYERTKAEAELEVARSGLRAAIARPSIVVGDTASGWTTAFNVLYFPLRAYARGLLDVIPADPEGIIDAIGVDAVIEGLLALHDDDGSSGTYALAAGPSAVTVEELAAATADLIGRRRPRFGDAALIGGGDAYLPYFDVKTTFDVTRGHALLRAPVQPITAYLPALLSYAEAARWGKRPVPARSRVPERDERVPA